MPPPLHIDPPSLTPTYTFTVPNTVQRKHTPAPGCPLCTILTTLEDAQPIPQLEQDPGRLGTDEQPFSPALPSPAVVQNPLLPSGPRSLGVKAVAGRLVLVDDDDLTAWVASNEETLTEEGRHVVVAFKRHVEDVYTFVRLFLCCILGRSFITHIHCPSTSYNQSLLPFPRAHKISPSSHTRS